MPDNQECREEYQNIKDDMKLVDVIKHLLEFEVIDINMYNTLNEMRKTRNRLAHNSEEYLSFEEIPLFELSNNARIISENLRKKCPR